LRARFTGALYSRRAVVCIAPGLIPVRPAARYYTAWGEAPFIGSGKYWKGGKTVLFASEY